MHLLKLQPIFNCQRTFDREDRRCSQDADSIVVSADIRVFPAECKRENRALTRGISAQPHLFFGGADRVRTDDPLLAKQVLSQLSYSPG